MSHNLTEMIYQQFYSELGKLLYAIADIDGKVSPAEKNALRDMVKSTLVPYETHSDDQGTNAAWYTEAEFDFLEENISDADAAFESFENFVTAHATGIDDNLRNICRQLPEKLAGVYRGVNKKEQALLARLKKLLSSLSGPMPRH